MNYPEGKAAAFTSQPSKGQFIALLAYLPVHVALLPAILVKFMDAGLLSEDWANFAVYAVGIVYMLIFAGSFLRRDFDPLCEQPFRIFIVIMTCYGLMLIFNLAVSSLMSILVELDNPNNDAVMELVKENEGPMIAMGVFMAPLVEELLFRAGIFGFLRKYSRTLAYIVSILLFSLYHVWGYALSDAGSWIYILQYIPASFLLCRCYERCNSIWGSIFMHMLINGISFRVLSIAEEIL
ncbi:MAG: CPBP family intramembrane glutamic endopeptidase [Candidatus Limivicinus sp.]|jgi:membrane protease YdiL (CAAX protease family)